MEIFLEPKNNDLCAYTHCFESGSFGLHYHQNLEMCQVIDKPCDFLVDGEIIYAEPGDIIVINEYVVHRFLIKNKDTNVRIIQFPLKSILNINAKQKPLKNHIKLSEIKNIPGLYEKLETLFIMMEQEPRTKNLADNLFFAGLTTSVYFLLAKYFVAEAYTRQGKKKDEFYKILEYVNSNFKEDINVKQIAAHFFIPRGRLSQLFKQYSGMSLNEYITSLRIKNANELLAEGVSVAEAALESGFQSIRTFNNTYKEIMGITPTDFVKYNKK